MSSRRKVAPIENPSRSGRVLALILLAFWILALIYTNLVPLGEAPDEVPHFNFVRFLAEKRSLPEGIEAGSEGFQPPLYYAIGALATFWLDPRKFEIRANTDFAWDRPETSRNLLLHTKAEAFPYQGGALAWHIVRVLSILMGTITIIATYLIGREVFPDKPSIALGMAAINAFTPEFIFMSSVVNNDNLIAMLSALLMLKLIRILKGATASGDFVQLGSLLGLALLAKSSALVFVPLALMVLFSAPAGKGVRLLRRASWSIITAVPALGFSGWWFLRNQFLYGDPLGWSLKVSISDLRQSPLWWKDVLWLFDGLFQSFWGRFGGAAHLRLGYPLYVALSLLMFASLGGCVVAIVRLARSRRLPDNPSPLLLFFAALGVALTFAALVRWTMAFLGTDQARLMYPALPALILFFLLGLLQLSPARLRKFTIGGLCLGLLTLAVVTPFAYIGPVYRPPQPLSIAEMSSLPNASALDFAGTARLLGYSFDKDLYEAGETVRLTLYWQAIGQIQGDQWLQIQLVDRSGRVIFQKEGCPSGGMYSADLWQAGEVVPGVHFLRLSSTVAPDSYALRLSLRPATSKAWLPAFDRRTGTVGDILPVGKLRVGRRSTISTEGVRLPINAMVGEQFSLLGYTLKGDEDLRPGGQIALTLHWLKIPGNEVDTRYTVFTQLLDASAAIQAQLDGEPVGGAYPTTVWKDEETVADTYRLVVNQQAKPGKYTLIAGLYDRLTGKRLPVKDAGGNPLGDHVRLAELTVQ